MKLENNTVASRHGFSLLEVMIAIGIFFMAAFAILGLVSSSLENARRLQRPLVDAGAVASWLSVTNRFVEGTYTVNLGEMLGDAYNGYDCTYEVLGSTNKLYQVSYFVQSTTGNHDIISSMTSLFYSPQSPARGLE